MSINNFQSRTLTENCAVEYDYPWLKFNGPVEFSNNLTGVGLRSLVSYARYTTTAQVVPSATTLYVNFNGGTTDISRFKVSPLTLTPFTTQQNFVVQTSGLYFIHFMTTYLTDPAQGQVYGTEIIYYPQGGPGEVISSAMIDRNNNAFTNFANTRTYFRYFQAGDEFTFRWRNTESNTCTLRVNIAYFAL